MHGFKLGLIALAEFSKDFQVCIFFILPDKMWRNLQDDFATLLKKIWYDSVNSLKQPFNLKKTKISSNQTWNKKQNKTLEIHNWNRTDVAYLQT
jgi:hypothetical protein